MDQENVSRRIACLIAFSLLPFASVASADASDPSAPIVASDYSHPVRVACVGDSITALATAPNGDRTSWVTFLGRMVDRHWQVTNFGAGGRTLLKNGDRSYQATGPMKKAIASQPDVVIVMLGTNDSKAWNWKLKDQFVPDYKDLVDQFKTLPTHPRIFLCLPPFVSGANRYKIEEAAVEEELPIVRQIAQGEHAGLIDLFTPSKAWSANFPDHVHPNEAAQLEMARVFYKTLTGQTYVGTPPAPPTTQKSTTRPASAGPLTAH